MKKLYIILLTLLVATNIFAADRFTIRKFAGMNTRLSPIEIKDSESPDMQNFDLDKAGVLTERSLFQHYNTTSVGLQPITDLYKFYKSTDAGFLIVVSGGIPYQATGNALVSKMITTATVTTATVMWDFETFTDNVNEIMYAATNDYELMYWNGIDDTFHELEDNTGPAEKCNILKKHKARLFAAGDETYPYRLYYSSLSNGSDWNTTGGTIDLPSYERIMALEILSDILYIFTRTGIYAMGGDVPDEFYIVPTRSTLGTHATRSVVLGNKIIFFLNKAGVFAFDGDQAVNISEVIQPTIDNISSTLLDKVACLYDKKGKLWITYTSQGTFNDTILVYDTVLKQWYELTGNFSAFFKADGGTDRGELYAGASDNTGWLWQLQADATTEQITHATKTQLETGVTFNTVVAGTETSPIVSLTGPYLSDTNTKLLLHLDGADGATSTTDASSSARTFSAFGGDGKLSTDQKALGSSSLYLDGSGDFIGTADSPDWDFAADFTIDTWIYLTDTITENVIAANTDMGATQAGWLFTVETGGNVMQFKAASGGSGFNLIDTGAAYAFSTNTWYHVAVVRESGLITFYVNGVTTGTPAVDASATTSTRTLHIGTDDGEDKFLTGYIDEFRISDIARWTTDFDLASYKKGGTLISDNLQINASGQSALGTIVWNESLPTDTDIQFTVRTGVTDDTTYDTWTEPWVSASSVSIDTVTNDTAWTSLCSSGANILDVTGNTTAQARNTLYYEPDDDLNPDCIEFTIGTSAWKVLDAKGYVSAATTIPAVDISDYKFIGYWLKSPVTGQSISLSLGEVTGVVVAQTTANTVNENDWEKHWWSIDGYTDSDIDAITYIQLDYLGEGKTSETRSTYLDEIFAYDFLDSGETMTSTPNDYIQYRAMFGTNSDDTPKLINSQGEVITLSFSIAGEVTESELTSYWTSKTIEAEYNNYFQWVEITGETSNPTTGNTVSIDYNCDDGTRTGTITDTFDVTGQRVKLRFYFPSGTFGKEMKLKIYDTDVDSNLEIHNLQMSFIKSGG